MAATLRSPAVTLVGRRGSLALAGLAMLAAVAAMAGPEELARVAIGVGCILFVVMRPQLGVAILLLLLMVQYGSRGVERAGAGGLLSALVPAGSGLLTVNNVLGVLLGLLLVYRVYRGADWSFTRCRTVQLVLAVTAVLVFSAVVSGISDADWAAIGLDMTTAQDPSRLLVSRALFVVLFVFFIEEPRDLLMMVGLFVVLCVVTAWSGSQFAIAGAGQTKAIEYRAGGAEVLISSTGNPNRLAMIATFGMVFIWEYAQSFRRGLGWRLMAMGSVLLMIVTVFLSASRGGLIGMAVAALLILARRSLGLAGVLRGLAIALVAAVFVAQMVPAQSLERILNIPGLGSADNAGAGTGSTERRGYASGIAIKIWESAPIIGVGPGNWPYVRYHVDPLRSQGAAHNSFLAALAEGGIVALALYMALFLSTIRGLWRLEMDPVVVQRARADGLEWLISATRICLLAFMVCSLFYDLWDLIFSYFLISVSAVLFLRYGPVGASAPRVLQRA